MASFTGYIDFGLAGYFTNTSSFQSGATWLWDFGDGATAITENPQHIYADTGMFDIWLKIVSLGGCIDSAMQQINIVPDVIVYIPNAFTPNGDGINDGFSFKGVGMQSEGFVFRIFDRWGQELFQTTDITVEWNGEFNGKVCPEDVYIYSIIITDNYDKEKKYIGNISIVR